MHLCYAGVCAQVERILQLLSNDERLDAARVEAERSRRVALPAFAALQKPRTCGALLTA